MSNLNNKNISLEILISTKGQKNLNFLDKMFKYCETRDFSILIIDQTDRSKINKLVSDNNKIRIFNISANGLSNSRNYAISKSNADICLLCDDDVIYNSNFDVVIKDSFKNNEDVVTYRAINSSGNLFKNYPNINYHNKNSISTVNTFLIAFKRLTILEKNIKFDPRFGLGSIFETADESIFLRNVLLKNLQIKSSHKVILTHKYISSGQKTSNNNIIYARAAYFYKYYGMLSYLKLIHHILLLNKQGLVNLNHFIYKYKVGLIGIKMYKSTL